MSNAIAVGVDGTSASRAALEWAVRRAELDNRPLILLHAIDDATHAASESDALVRAELDYARAVSTKIDVSFEVHRGEPVKVLAEEAPRFDTLVVGTHKTGFLRGRAFGSTSLRLAALLTTPLAVIPVPSGGSRRGVLVGVDDELNAISAVRHGAKEAQRLNALLTLMHAQKSDSVSPISAAVSLVRKEYPDVDVRQREVVGNAGEALVNAAMAAEVLFIGGPAAHSGVGAVAYDVLLNIAGPTIMVPYEHEPATLAAT